MAQLNGSYKVAVKGRPPGRESWGTMNIYSADSEFLAMQQAQASCEGWQRAAMDMKSTMYGWEFKIANV